VLHTKTPDLAVKSGSTAINEIYNVFEARY